MFEDADLELRAAVICVMATTQIETDVDVEAGAETEATRKVGDMSTASYGGRIVDYGFYGNLREGGEGVLCCLSLSFMSLSVSV